MAEDSRVVRELITPARAQELLHTVTPTYRWKENVFRRIQGSMQRGTFKSEVSHELVVDHQGVLYNGRHRLTAQVTEDLSFYYDVRYCGTAEAIERQRFGDSGSSWSTSDQLKRAGKINTSPYSSAITYLHRFRETGAVTSRQAPSVDLALAIFEAHPGIEAFIGPTYVAARKFKISHGMCAAVAYITAAMGVPGDTVTEFWQLLGLVAAAQDDGRADAMQAAITAVSVKPKSPLWTFGEWITSTKPEKTMARRRSENVTWVYLHLTWNSWIEGRTFGRKGLIWDGNSFPSLSDGNGLRLQNGSIEAQELLGKG